MYIGLDLHREFFVRSCISDGVVVKRYRMPGIDRILVEEGKNEPLDSVYRSVPGIDPLIARVLSSTQAAVISAGDTSHGKEIRVFATC